MDTGDRISELYKGLANDKFSEQHLATARERIQWMCQQVDGQRVIDIGCSQGIVSILLARQGFEVVGVDTDAGAIEYANSDRAKEPPEVQRRLTFLCSDIRDADLPERTFDTVIMGEFLEHQENPDESIRQVHGLLAGDGRLIVTVPFGLDRSPDHRQTFYVASLHRLIYPYFAVDEVEMIGRYLCLLCKRRAAVLLDQVDSIDLSLAERAEDEFLRREMVLTRERDRSKEEATKARAEVNGARAELNGARAELIRGKKETTRLKAELARERRALQQIRNSVPYQVGNMLVRPVRRPGLFVLRLAYRVAARSPAWFRRLLQRLASRNRLLGSLVTFAATTSDSSFSAVVQALPAIPPRNAVRQIDCRQRTTLMVLFWSLPYASNGYAVRSHGLLSGLYNAGWDITAYTRPGYPWDSRAHTGPKQPESAHVGEITYHHVKGPNVRDVYSNYGDYFEKSARIIESLARKSHPTLIHAASNHLVGLPSLIAARRLGLPFVYEVRGLWEMTEASVNPALEESELFKLRHNLESLVAREADYVITLTSKLRDELVSRGVRREDIRIVPNCVDVGRFKPLPPDNDLQARLGLSDAPTIGYIGSFVAYEGLDDLVKAAAMLKERGVRFNLLLVGEGKVLNEIRELTKKLELDKEVFLTGRVPHDEVEGYYSLIDIAPFPRKPVPVCEMVSPLKPLEAMAMGKVVVASSVDALKDTVVDRETGLLFEKGVVQALADTLAEVIADRDLAARLSSQGLDWVRKNRTWGMGARETVAVYEALCSRDETRLAACTQRAAMSGTGRQRHTRIALYADANMNLMDGSSVWTASVVEALAGLEYAEVFLFLKSKEKRSLLTEPLKAFKNVTLISPTKDDHLVGDNLTPAAALDKIEDTDRHLGFDAIVLRGLSLCEKASLRAGLQGRLWNYLTDIPQQSEEITESMLATLDRIAGASKYILCQTDEFCSHWEKHVASAQGKTRLLPPMIPDFPARIEDPTGIRRICYAGKFAPLWGVLEMFEAFGSLRAAHPVIELHVFGDKIHNPPGLPDFQSTVLSHLEDTVGVFWHRALSREEVLSHMEKMDLGWAWRSPELENNTLELSTKILEYGSAGLPVILFRNKVNERLLGTDYPLFANTYDECVNLLRQLVKSPDTLAIASRKTYAASQGFTMERVRDRHIRPLFEDASTSGIPGKPSTRGSILVAGHDLKFIDRLYGEFAALGRDVLIDAWTGHEEHDERASRTLLDKADTIICEWCLGNAVWYSMNKRAGQKLIVRFHLQERDLEYPELVDMDNVDAMVFVGPHLRREAISRFGWERWADGKLVVISNYVDTKALDLPKPTDAQFNIGIVGIVPQRKRFDLALDVIERLRREDERFQLHVKGKTAGEYPWMQSRPKELRYYEDQTDRIKNSDLLKGAVHFDGWGDDMPEWYRKMGFVLSVSDFESFHLSVPEGAASRAIPLMLKWEGAEEIYPEDWSYHTVDELGAAILDIVRSGRFEGIAESRYSFARTNFDIERVARLWLDIIERPAHF